MKRLLLTMALVLTLTATAQARNPKYNWPGDRHMNAFCTTLTAYANTALNNYEQAEMAAHDGDFNRATTYLRMGNRAMHLVNRHPEDAQFCYTNNYDFAETVDAAEDKADLLVELAEAYGG